MTPSHLADRITVEGQDYDLHRLERSDLLALKLRLDEAITRIDEQIERSRQEVRDHGETNTAWYIKARHARRMKGLQAQAIQAELARRRNDHQARLECAFMDVARQRLADEVYAELLAEAQTLAKKTRQAEAL